MKPNIKKLLILNAPYLLFVYLFDKVGQGGYPTSRRTGQSPLPPASWEMILTALPFLPFWNRTPTEPPSRPQPYPNTPAT